VENAALDNAVWEKLLFARKVPLQTQLFLFGSIGIVAAIKPPPQNLFDPFLLLIIPAWCLYVFSDVYQFLCKPRTCDFAFISGISYSLRRRVARSFIKRRMIELIIISGMIIGLFFIVRSMICGITRNSDHFIFSVMLIAELCISLVLFAWLIAFSMLKPVRYDKNHFLFSVSLRKNWLYWIRKRFSVFCWKMAGLGSWFFNNKTRALIKRQWLYLYRYDWFAFFVLQGVALIVSVLIGVVLYKENILASTLVLLIAPGVLLCINSPAFFESIGKLHNCPYYSAPGNALFTANSIICSMLYVPYALIFAAQFLFIPFDWPIIRIIISSASFLLCVTAILLTFAFRFSSAGLAVINTVHFAITILCTFIATTSAYQGSAVAGIFFPMLPIAVIIRDRIKFIVTVHAP